MLSKRGAKWSQVDYAHGEQRAYDPVSFPECVVSFANAENSLMHDVMADFMNKNKYFDKKHCTYGEGYTGSLRLRSATAKHLNTYFDPASKIDAEQITFTAGVTELNEVSALVTCDEGEAIMLGRPVYGTFGRDLGMRTGVHLEWVSVGDTEQFGVECVAAYEAGFEAARQRGVNVKALLICNPHNPLGCCYPRETLVELMRLCGSKGIHLISDEIYAMSTYSRDDRSCQIFTSLRAIDPRGLIDPSQVHVLYGMSKDYAAAGLRLGCVVSQNKQLTDAVRAVCRFSSPSQFSMALATSFLEDREFVESFFQKSHKALRDSRLLAEKLLEENGIPYSKPGNSGLFIWIDLGKYLPIEETHEDGWEAERLLNRRLRQEGGVIMSTGELYHAEKPGRFRLVHSMPEPVVREGINRIRRTITQSKE